jgi:CheY-like chemotaxis protein
VLRRAVGEDIEVELSLGKQLGSVEVDAAELEVALLNLLVNARDAMPGGGRIQLRTRERELPAKYDPKAGEDERGTGRYVIISVEDNGSGMSPEVRARAMEPFFTTKEVGRGSGLGLSQVYGFAAQSGGYVTIDSSEGRGTTIELHLPVREGEGEAEPEPEASPKILLVEDDPDVQLVTVEALRYMGYSVVTADEGGAALEILRRDPAVDVLFTDVVMPKGVDGLELLREARKLRPGLRVLLASGYARGRLPVVPEGCDFIAKPYRIEDLEARLRSLLQRTDPSAR